MSLAVVDASVLVAWFLVDDPRRAAVTERLARGDALFAPAHIDAEIVSALRGLARTNPAVDALVPAALAYLRTFPVRRMPLAPLLNRMWDLRHTVTPNDAAYVALAERLGAALLTCDARLSRASGTGCAFDVI